MGDCVHPVAKAVLQRHWPGRSRRGFGGVFPPLVLGVVVALHRRLRLGLRDAGGSAVTCWLIVRPQVHALYLAPRSPTRQWTSAARPTDAATNRDAHQEGCMQKHEPADQAAALIHETLPKLGVSGRFNTL
jgi:hypothetical protein